MFESSMSQQEQPREQTLSCPVGMEERIKLWTLDELATAKGVMPEDILYYVSNGSLKAKRSPTRGVLLFPSNAHVVFEQLFFGDLGVRDESQALTVSALRHVHTIVKPLRVDTFDVVEDNLRGGISEALPKENEFSVSFLDSMETGTRSFSSYPCLWVRKGKKSTVFFLRVKGHTDLVLLKHKNTEPFTQKQLDYVVYLHTRFSLLRSENVPWNSLTYLKEGSRQKVVTFNDLLVFYRDLPDTSQSTITQINRMLRRYFSGEKGDRKIEAYCSEQFAKDFLDAPTPDRAKTDRDTVIKLIGAAYNKAKSSSVVEKFDFTNLGKNQPRNRSDDTSKEMPRLNTYISILRKGVELGHYEMVLNLLLQESMLTRKARTTHQEVSTLNLDELAHEIPAHQNKNRKLGRLLMPLQIKELLETYLGYLSSNPKITKTPDGQPKFLFESPLRKGQPRANFDDQFNTARKSVINTIEASCAENKGALIKETRKFTPHRLRDLSDELLIDVGATLGQKEKAAGRSTKDVERAYEDLTEDKIIELKTKKFNLIVKREPDYQWVIDTLIDKWKMQ